MKKISTIFFFFLLIGVKSQQAPNLSVYKTSEQKLKAWAEYCDVFLEKGDYKNLRKAAVDGKRMTSLSDNYNLSLFYFYIGITFDYGTETDSALFYIERSEQFARKVKHARRTIEALKQLLNIYNNNAYKAQRERVVKEILFCIDTTKNSKQKVRLYGDLFNYYSNQGQYERALTYLLNEIQMRESLLNKASNADSVNYGVSLLNTVDLHLKIGNAQKGLPYLKESEPFLKTYKAGVSKVNKTYVDVYLNIGKPTEANVYYEKLILYIETRGFEEGWYDVLACDLSFADYHLTRNETKLAFLYTQHALKLAPKYADAYLLGDINYMSGQVNLQLKNYSVALSYFKKAEPVIKEISLEQNSWIQKAFAQTYAGLGKWDLAYSYQTKYAQLQDTLLTEKAKKNVSELEEVYQNEKKQQAIAALSKENKIKNLELATVSKQRLFFIISFLLVVVIGLLVFYQSYLRKKSNVQLQKLNAELDQANKIKARFFSILNHDLRSPVSNLIHFLHLQKNAPELLTAETKIRLENKTIYSAEQLLISMEDILLWSKEQMQQFKPSYELVKIETLFEGLKNQFITTENVEIAFENQLIVPVKTDANYLKTILRNLTSNAIKALEKTPNAKITWKAWHENTTIYLSITDNGPGGTQEQFKALYDDTEVTGIHTGLGLHLIRDLAKAINCKITLHTKANEGTKFVLEMS